MKGILLSFLMVFFLIPDGFADEFTVKYFKAVPSDLTARRHEKSDANGIPCAIIKIMSDLDGLKFESNLQIVDWSYESGEYVLYISQGEKRIRILKNGFIPLEYTIPIRVESYMVYQMEIRRKVGERNIDLKTGSYKIESEPSEATISLLPGYTDFNNQHYKTPHTINISSGAKVLMLTHPRYDTLYDTIFIDPDKPKKSFYKLKPKMGELVITGGNNASGAKIFINDSLLGKLPLKPITLPVGTYRIKCEKDGFFTLEQLINVTVNENQTTRIQVEMTNNKPVKLVILPDDAEVILDGRKLPGISPYTVSVFIGTHSIRIDKDGYNTLDKTFNVTQDNDYYPFELQGEKSRLEIDSKSGTFDIVDLNLYIDENYVGSKSGSKSLFPGNYSVEFRNNKNGRTIKKMQVKHPSTISPVTVLLPSKWGIQWGAVSNSWFKNPSDTSVFYSNPTLDFKFLNISYHGLTISPFICDLINPLRLPDKPVMTSFFTNLKFQTGGNLTRWSDFILFGSWKYSFNINYQQSENKPRTKLNVHEYAFGFGLSVYPLNGGWFSLDLKYGIRNANIAYEIWDGQKTSPGVNTHESTSFFEIEILILGSILDGKTLRLWKRPLVEVGSY